MSKQEKTHYFPIRYLTGVERTDVTLQTEELGLVSCSFLKLQADFLGFQGRVWDFEHQGCTKQFETSHLTLTFDF